MKATAKAPANIAFIKYWGKKDEKLRLPANDSISMNLSNVFTITTVEFSEKIKKDIIIMDEHKFDEKEEKRISSHLDLIRDLARFKSFARVKTKNNFPKGSGIASSASGFAALTMAGVAAAGLKLNEKHLSIIARQGSGSACRSIPDGFVEWKSGTSSNNSYAHMIFPPNWWKIIDVLVIVEKKTKKVSSSEGHILTASSPFYKSRISGIKNKLTVIKKAILDRDFEIFGTILEGEAINMHAVMMTSTPPIFYWTPVTFELILTVRGWREEGILVYFTIDAGANVHLICQEKDKQKVIGCLKGMKGIKEVILNQPAIGTRLINKHLF
ncbi:diphosphomevalonate decarboxylase [Candidatus Shapirobacteria bacterium CG07_land_8_20_14_0_80_39_18]|uniref:diphosphomevalonate decarboxylase n=1 Tax=Candidatus Shapirobacteria bacterium CG07_land_8_20_14_0_80_39_18 TaxID=1974882 RepID=A0A2M6YQZ8_9BACT|nr:MAG: diphosphomevalonate decarboxylase [Candidatus Shapirobacteria bacterium CG07_land_8_20_14_0_80_39_18]